MMSASIGRVMASEIVPERDVERVFHLRCSCGASLVSNGRKLSCAKCGKTLEVRRVRTHEHSPVTVEYRFSCSFCDAPLVSTAKTTTCTACGRPLRLLRGSRHTRRRSYHPGPVLKQWCFGMAIAFLVICYLLDWTSC